jgi:hypothetical protein
MRSGQKCSVPARDFFSGNIIRKEKFSCACHSPQLYSPDPPIFAETTFGVDVNDEFPFLVTKMSPYYDQ